MRRGGVGIAAAARTGKRGDSSPRGSLTPPQLYWLGMTHKVGTKGQVVIPKPLRERQGLGPGVPVAFEERPDGVLVRAEAGPEQLRGRYRGTGMAAKLLEDRSAEPR